MNDPGEGNRPLRVLFVESGTEVGGAQMALLTMLQNLDRKSVTPTYASLGFGKGDLPEVVAHCIVGQTGQGCEENLRRLAAETGGEYVDLQ